MANKDERGFWINGKGETYHPDNVRVVDKIKDDMVERLGNTALQMSTAIADFKKNSNDEVNDYFALLLQDYGVDAKSKSVKGNISLENFSSTFKVELSVSENLQFDERIQVAKSLVDEFLIDETKGASPTIQTLITKAFEVDKKGNIDAKKIFALKQYDIQDERWNKAMSIIDESKKVAFTRSYIRFYTRESTDQKWVLIPLDIAAV